MTPPLAPCFVEDAHFLFLLLAAVERVRPVAAMVCNFSKPSPVPSDVGGSPELQPSLLRHEEVVTLFHEYAFAP